MEEKGDNPVFNRVYCGQQRIFRLSEKGSQTYAIPEGATHIGFRAGKFGFFKSDYGFNWNTKNSHRFIRILPGAKEVEIISENKTSGWTYEARWKYD